jgi:SPP1 gp7 family putative phage head morphogenesis protein
MAVSKKKAPKHPVAPEAKLRSAMAAALKPSADRLAAAISQGDHEAVREALADLSSKLDRSTFEDMVTVSAVETADSARRQVAQILGLDDDDFDPDMEAEIAQMVDNLHDIATGAAADMIERANDLLDGDDDISDGDAQDSLDGAVGTALGLTSMAFVYGFAKFNRIAQSDAGVKSYTWHSLHDDRVRAAHEHLDGVEFDWDDPPLGADESSSGEDCHAGEDFNCRCTADPVVSQVEQETEADDNEEASAFEEAA